MADTNADQRRIYEPTGTFKAVSEDVHDDSPVASEQSVSDQLEAGASGAQADPEKLSVLGPTVVFKGELSADEDLLIQGQIEGSIEHNAQHLTIGSQGKVKADVYANHIMVQGEVRGDLYGKQAVIVEASARVRGNIYAPRVALKEGAKFKGSIDMDVTDEMLTKRSPSKSTTAAKEAPSAPKRPAKSSGRSKSSGGAQSSKADDAAPESDVEELLKD
jgi:cytoskeletal protein CcmA (bactofilin family)